MGETILLDLDLHDANMLVLEPSLNYDNILQRNLGVYKFVTGKNKLKMLHLNRPNNVLQPKTSCDEWNPTLNFGLRPYEIECCEFELNGEQCPDTFDNECLKNLKAAPDEAARFNSLLGQKSEYNALEFAMIQAIRDSIRDSLFKVAWFGNENFGEWLTANDCGIEECMSPKEISKLVKMLETCNGWWAEIMARAQIKDPKNKGKVGYLNTNNGTPQGNATNPSNIAEYLRRMRTSASPLLQFWNLNGGTTEKPCYLLQKGLYDALIRYYQSLGCLKDCSLIWEGMPMDNATTFEGYPVYLVPEWTMFDFELGCVDPETGYSKYQRSLFTVKENLCGLSNMSSLEGRFGSALTIAADPSLKAKGKKYIYGCYGLGFGIAQPTLMVAGWNSSTTYL